MEEEGQLTTSLDKYGGLLVFTLFFLGGSYLNMYLLVPKLLFANKWGAYFCSLLGLVALIMTSLIFAQTLFFDMIAPIEVEEINVFSLIINLLSSSLSIFLLFAGTTTLLLFKFWILDMKKTEELESSTLQLELQLLENQINPHFLFNMLNNVNILIRKEPDSALYIIRKLEEMLRYQMGDKKNENVCLKDEMVFLDDFLELEKSRRDDFNYEIIADSELNNLYIPPLLFTTFVENAIKHSQDSKAASFVRILFEMKDGKLIFLCENSIPQGPSDKSIGGIGLVNVRRRLELLYKDNYLMKHTKTDTCYMVRLELSL